MYENGTLFYGCVNVYDNDFFCTLYTWIVPLSRAENMSVIYLQRCTYRHAKTLLNISSPILIPL